MANVSSSNGLEKYPKLRFKGFSEPWEHVKLSDFVSRVTRKNSDNQTDIPLTISSKDGLINQNEFFSKQVASKDMSGYYLLQRGEFAYNKSYSVGFDFGSIKRLEKYDQGALSTLYICFALNRFDSDFIKHYFDSLKWYREIYMISAEGARNHGLLNVPTEDFFATLHTLPMDTAEQRKIAEFLDLLTSKIEKQQSLVDNLKKYKRGLLDAIFNQKIHVTDGNEEWQECRIGDILKILHGRDYKDYQATNGEYPVLGTGGVIDHATKYLCDWPCVLIGRKGTIDKPQYMDKPFWTVDTLFYSKPESSHDPKFQYYLFQTINWKKYNEASGVPSQSSSTIEGINVNVPNLKTQEAIANLFSQIDELIDDYSVVLSHLQDYKKGLLQKLFI